jgi:hypothetical protein
MHDVWLLFLPPCYGIWDNNVASPMIGIRISGGVHVIIIGDVCQLAEAFGSSRRQ